MRRRAAVSSHAAGLAGDAVARPGARGRLEGVGEPVLGEVEASVLRDEQGQQASPLVAQRPVEREVRGGHTSTSRTGRTSMAYSRGSSAARAAASTSSGRSTR